MNKKIKRDMKKASIPETPRIASNFVSFSGTPFGSSPNITPIYQSPDIISSPTTTTTAPAPIVVQRPALDTNFAETFQDMQAKLDAARAAQKVEFNNRYDYLMNTPIETLVSQGYFVGADGSILKGTQANYSIYLPLQDFQEIENQRMTAGALLVKFQAYELAKDTAGHQAGGSTSFSGTQPNFPVIPVVDELPPVIKEPDGTVTFSEPPNNPLPTTVDNTGGATSQSGLGGISLQSIMPGGSKYWWVWYLAAIAIIIIYVKFVRK